MRPILFTTGETSPRTESKSMPRQLVTYHPQRKSDPIMADNVVILWFLHHHRASPVQINAVETDNVTCQELILFCWSRTPWYNMDRVWFDKLVANTELVNTYNIFSSLFVIYLRISLTFHFIYSRSLIKYTKSKTRDIFHT